MTETAPEDDRRIRVFYNTNVDMSKGKLAAHVAHAVLAAAGVHPNVPVVVLGGKPRDIERMTTFIRDHGKTELTPGTLTAGTDYVFESNANRARAIHDLTALAAELDDVASARIRAVIELLTIPPLVIADPPM